MAIAERTKIVKPENVIGVAVRVKHGVKVANMLADGLLAEVRSGIDEHAFAAVLDQNGRPGTAVVRIAGVAHGAVASDGRNSHRSAAAQHRERGLHRFAAVGAGVCGGRASALVTSTYAMRSS